MTPPTVHASSADTGLTRESFLGTLSTQLADVLQETVGLEDAHAFIGLVGLRMGRSIDADYRSGLGVDELSQGQVADVLVDLKHRIGGTFSVAHADDREIVLTNSRCPFADQAVGRPALCAMTSNVFGTIAADNLGYAKVELVETIAEGHGRCSVTVHLRADEKAAAAAGHEYFGPDDAR